jgi:hypothetical protein
MTYHPTPSLPGASGALLTRAFGSLDHEKDRVTALEDAAVDRARIARLITAAAGGGR